MNLSKECSKLTHISVSQCKSKNYLEFICGDYKSNLRNLISSVIPYGKVAFITFPKTHEEHGKELLSVINKSGSKLVSLIIPKNKIGSVDYASILFRLPEDIRAVITMDKELATTCTYYANIKKIPFVYIPVCTSLCQTLSSVLYMKNGNKIDKIITDVKKYVLIDENKISDSDLSLAFSHVTSKIVALTDYRIYYTLNKPVNKIALSLMAKAVSECIKIFSCPIDERKSALISYGLKIELASFLAGEILPFTAESFSAKLTDSGIFEDRELAFAIKITEIYSDCFILKEFLPTIPNYNSRVEEVAKRLNISEAQVIESVISQSQDFKTKQREYINAINSLSEDVKKYYSVISKIKSTYLALGGKPSFGLNEREVINAIKYSGETPYFFNGMSILRELGVTDTLYFED